MSSSTFLNSSSSDGSLAKRVNILSFSDRKCASDVTVSNMAMKARFVYYDNLDTSSSKLISTEEMSMSEKRIPKWLLEFDSFPASDTMATLAPECPSTRPVTESSATRPLWFEEMVQQRRHSDEVIQSLSQLREMSLTEQSLKLKSPEVISLLHDETGSSRGDLVNHVDGDDDFLALPKSSRRPRTIKFLATPDNSDGMSSGNKSSSSSSVDEAANDAVNKESSLFFRKTSVPREQLEDKSLDFVIPELPTGQELVLEVHSNWGDDDYVGLNGVEVFDANTGNLATIEKVWCHEPSSTSIECLVNSVQRTHDDNHIWMANFSTFAPLTIHFRFSTPIAVGLIRIWNFNKSRIHSYRGVRDIVLTLDEVTIFRGEIARACGELKGPPERFGDTILFTTSDKILEAIAVNDLSFTELIAGLF